MLDEELVKETQELLGDIVGASLEVRVKVLAVVSDTIAYLVDQARSDLEFEHDLAIFNQHGTEADPPFGAMLINGRVLVCNYRTAVGVWVNGHVKDKGFITREVEVRRDWPNQKAVESLNETVGEKGYVRNW